jgi:hypothetical protein
VPIGLLTADPITAHWDEPYTLGLKRRGIVRGADPLTALVRAPGPEARANQLRKELRLFPGGSIAALVDLVVMDELGICPLRPPPRALRLVRGGVDGDRDCDVLGAKKASLGRKRRA